MSLARLTTRLRGGTAAALVSTILAACGGGGAPTKPPIAETPPGPVPVATPQVAPAVVPAPADLSSYLGDGGSGIPVDGTGRNARFYDVLGVTLDADGNAYAIEAYSGVIRKITPQGVVTTLPKSGCQTRPTDLTLGRDGHLYILGVTGRLCRQTLAGEFTEMTALSDQFPGPEFRALARGPGNDFFVASSSAVYRVTPGAGATRVAGIERSGSRVVSQDDTGATVSFGGIGGITADEAGNVYVADISHGVRKVTPQGTVTTLARMPDMPVGHTVRRMGIVLESNGSVIVPSITTAGDFRGSSLLRVAPDGRVSTVPGSEDLFPTVPALARDAAGNITYTGTGGLGRVMAGGTAVQLAGRGLAGLGQPTKEEPVGIDTAGNLITFEEAYLAQRSRTLRKRNPAGQLVAYGPGRDAVALPAALSYAFANLAAGADGTVYASYTRNPRADPDSPLSGETEIYRVSPSGETTRILAARAQDAHYVAPLAMAVAPDGTLYFADARRAALIKLTPDGAVVAVTPDNELVRHNDPTMPVVSAQGDSSIGVSPAGKVHVFSRVGRVYTVNSAGLLEPLANRTFNWTSPPVFDSQGNVYVLEPRLLSRITPAGVTTAVTVLPDANAAVQIPGPFPGSPYIPRSLARSADGVFYLQDKQSIIRIRPSAP